MHTSFEKKISQFFGWVLCTGLSGLAVTYGLNLNEIISWIIWNLSTLQTKIISVERIQQYTHIASEAPWVIEENHPPATWPSHGTIELQNLQVHNLIHAQQHKISTLLTFANSQPKKEKNLFFLFFFFFWLNLSSKIFAKKIKVDAKMSEKRSHEGSKLSLVVIILKQLRVLRFRV